MLYDDETFVLMPSHQTTEQLLSLSWDLSTLKNCNLGFNLDKSEFEPDDEP